MFSEKEEYVSTESFCSKLFERMLSVFRIEHIGTNIVINMHRLSVVDIAFSSVFEVLKLSHTVLQINAHNPTDKSIFMYEEKNSIVTFRYIVTVVFINKASMIIKARLQLINRARRMFMHELSESRKFAE